MPGQVGSRNFRSRGGNRLGNHHPDLRGLAIPAKRNALFHRRPALITGIFHRLELSHYQQRAQAHAAYHHLSAVRPFIFPASTFMSFVVKGLQTPESPPRSQPWTSSFNYPIIKLLNYKSPRSTLLSHAYARTPWRSSNRFHRAQPRPHAGST